MTSGMKKFLIAWGTGITLFLLGMSQPVVPCSALIAGKNTTRDGSILFAKTEDDRPGDVDYLWFVPAARHRAGSMLKLRGGGRIPQVAATYGYFWDQCPGTEYSNSLVNEWGLALGSNACSSREESVEELEKQGYVVNGGIGWRLRFILAERCRTAREAVQMAARLLDRYGYRGSGRTLSIVGLREAWILQMVRGKQYVARRVQDDEVVIVPNAYTIRQVDLNDTANFICSPNLIRYARERGWYDPQKDGEFDFARVYSHPETLVHRQNTRRHWMMARMVNPGFDFTLQDADHGKMPVAVKPDRKLALEDIFQIFRTHFEGTDLDTSDGYARSPHQNPNRPVCVSASHRTTVVQQRSWLPREIGTVVWRALAPPCSSGFVPWYLGVTDIPPAFQKAPMEWLGTGKDFYDYHFSQNSKEIGSDPESASWVFGLMAGLVDADYRNVIDYVRHTWDEFESAQIHIQPEVEKTALDLHRKDPVAAVNFLTAYTHSRASRSLDIARRLMNTLLHRLWKARHGTGLH